MKEISAGIIGLGRSGRDIHAAAMRQMPDMYRITAVSDPLEGRRTRAAKELGCEVYADYRELLQRNDLDLIVNATPSQMHVPVSLECLNSGFHVLCEKPLARRVADVDALFNASQRTGRIIAVYQQLRFAPAFERMIKVISSGVIGRIVQANITASSFNRRWDWQTLQEKDGGSLLNKGTHYLDQALQLYGTDMMPTVICRMDKANSFGDAEDYVKMILCGDGRPLVDVEISSCCAYPGATYQVQGTHGGIKGSDDRLEWKYYKPEEAPEQHLVVEALSKGDGTPSFCREELKWYEDCWEPADELEANPFHAAAMKYYEMLYNALATEKPLVITPQEIRRQVAVIEQCFMQNPHFSKGHIKGDEVE